MNLMSLMSTLRPGRRKREPANKDEALAQVLEIVVDDLDAIRQKVQDGPQDLMVKVGDLSNNVGTLAETVHEHLEESGRIQRETLEAIRGIQGTLAEIKQDHETFRDNTNQELARLRRGGMNGTNSPT